MAIPKKIVDTRKLNANNKAKLGRGGDTKIRKVDGKKSHVNALEAYLIDVNGKAGEEYAKRVGAGTTNPLTGMPEFYSWDDFKKSVSKTVNVITDPLGAITDLYEDVTGKDSGYTSAGDWTTDPSGSYEDTSEKVTTLLGAKDTTTSEYTGPTGRQDYETLAGMSPEDLEAYLQNEFGMGADSMQYIEGFQEEPFGFLEETQALATKGLESSYGATMGALGSQQEALSRGTGRGYAQATGAAATAASRSGLATSGTITQGLETQKKQLFQDYTAGMGDIGRERGTALETLTLGKEGADLDFRASEYAEKKRQLDELYADVASVPS